MLVKVNYLYCSRVTKQTCANANINFIRTNLHTSSSQLVRGVVIKEWSFETPNVAAGTYPFMVCSYEYIVLQQIIINFVNVHGKILE